MRPGIRTVAWGSSEPGLLLGEAASTPSPGARVSADGRPAAASLISLLLDLHPLSLEVLALPPSLFPAIAGALSSGILEELEG